MSGPRPVTVLGAGGHGKVVLSTLRAAGVPVAALYDDSRESWGTEVLGIPIRGPLRAAVDDGVREAVIGVGDNHARRRIAEELELDWRTAVHPEAWIDASVRLGPGAVVFAGAVIQPEAVIGRHAIVNTGATVDHDCRLGDFVHVAPGAHLAGGVAIGEGALLGVASAVVPGVAIGAWATVGAGAVVLRDLRAGVTAVGTPALPLPRGR